MDREFWKEIGRHAFLAVVEGASIYVGHRLGEKVGDWLVPPVEEDGDG